MHSPADFLETDQIQCYRSDGQVVACEATGQDASFKARPPLPADRRFQVLDAVVRDVLTGAVWSVDANLPEFPLTWDEAQMFAADMRARRDHGRSDWQLPSRRLLFALISHQQVNPALAVGHPFHNVFTGYYWTADTCRRLQNQAWYVHLGGGRVHRGMKHGSYMVWPVSMQDAGCDDRRVVNADRFTIDGSCVNDRSTGLNWSRDANPTAGSLDWQEALDAVSQMNTDVMGGHTDWRVPTIRELESLISLASHSPALPSAHPFLNVRDAYWSSTTSVYEPRYAWAVYMQDGIVGVGFKPGTDFHLWPVRG